MLPRGPTTEIDGLGLCVAWGDVGLAFARCRVRRGRRRPVPRSGAGPGAPLCGPSDTPRSPWRAEPESCCVSPAQPVRANIQHPWYRKRRAACIARRPRRVRRAPDQAHGLAERGRRRAHHRAQVACPRARRGSDGVHARRRGRRAGRRLPARLGRVHGALPGPHPVRAGPRRAPRATACHRVLRAPPRAPNWRGAGGRGLCAVLCAARGLSSVVVVWRDGAGAV